MSGIDPRKLFVGGISQQTDENKLRVYFSQYGTVTETELKRDPASSEERSGHRGFGFVTFENPESVTAVLSHPMHLLDNKRIDPKPAEVKGPGRSAGGFGVPMGGGGGGGGGGDDCEKKVFIGGIGAGTTEQQVREYFTNTYCVSVTEVDFKYCKETSRMRGFGFVKFTSADDVGKVTTKRFHEINGKSVEVKRAQPRGGGTQQATQQAATALKNPYYPYSYDYSQANGQNYQQYYSQYYGAAGFDSSAAAQAAAAAAAYGQYTAGGGYSYDPSLYSSSTQAGSTAANRQSTHSYYQQAGLYGHSGGGGTTQQVAGGYGGQDSGSFPGRTTAYSGQDTATYGGQSSFGGTSAPTSTAQQSTGHFPPSSYGNH